MPSSVISLGTTLVGPGAYSYPVSNWPGGAILFVNSATGVDGRGRVQFQGTSASVGTQPFSALGPFGDPNKPLKSVFGTGGAMSFVSTGRGDVIVVAPGHSEIIPAGTFQLPGGVSVVGVGYGNARPVFQWNNTTTLLNSNGAGGQLNNCIFDLTQVATVPLGFQFQHSGWQFNGCRIIQASATNQATQAIKLMAGADDFSFFSSEIDGTAATIANGIGIGNPAANNINRCEIINSFIHGLYGTAPVSFLSTGTSEALLENNTIRQEHAATTFVLVIPAGTSFLISLSFNSLYSLAAAAANLANFISGTTNTGFASFQNFAVRGVTPETPGVLL